MIGSIKENVARRQFQKAISESPVATSTSFNHLIKDGRIVILFPLTKEKEHEANNNLNFFFDHYPKSEFLIIKPSELKKEDLAFSGLPKPTYFSQFSNIHMVIDLSECFNRINTFIVARIHATLKIRLYASDEGEEVYHLSLKNETSDLKHRLHNLYKYSQILKGVVS